MVAGLLIFLRRYQYAGGIVVENSGPNFNNVIELHFREARGF